MVDKRFHIECQYEQAETRRKIFCGGGFVDTCFRSMPKIERRIFDLDGDIGSDGELPAGSARNTCRPDRRVARRVGVSESYWLSTRPSITACMPEDTREKKSKPVIAST